MREIYAVSSCKCDRFPALHKALSCKEEQPLQQCRNIPAVMTQLNGPDDDCYPLVLSVMI